MSVHIKGRNRINPAKHLDDFNLPATVIITLLLAYEKALQPYLTYPQNSGPDKYRFEEPERTANY